MPAEKKRKRRRLGERGEKQMERNKTAVSMADLMECWKDQLSAEGQPLESEGIPWDRTQEFFRYSMNHLDSVLEQIKEKKMGGATPDR